MARLGSVGSDCLKYQALIDEDVKVDTRKFGFLRSVSILGGTGLGGGATPHHEFEEIRGTTSRVPAELSGDQGIALGTR